MCDDVLRIEGHFQEIVRSSLNIAKTLFVAKKLDFHLEHRCINCIFRSLVFEVTVTYFLKERRGPVGTRHFRQDSISSKFVTLSAKLGDLANITLSAV